MTYRLATPADLETCALILEVSDDALNASHNVPAFPRNRPALIKLMTHILERDPERTWIAQQHDRAVLDHDLTVEAGELTPSLKVKRKVVEDNNRAILDGFYS